MIKETPASGQLGTSSTGPGNVSVPVSVLRKLWLRENGHSGRSLAARFGLSAGRTSNILTSGECPRRYIEILRGLGMPEELLPAPSRETPGPAVGPVQGQSAA